MSSLSPHLGPSSPDFSFSAELPGHENDRSLLIHPTQRQPFGVSLTYGGNPPAVSSLTFTVETGSTAALQTKTRVAFGVTGSPPNNNWGAVQTAPAPGTMSFSIFSPVNAGIGRYRFGIRTGGSSAPSSLLGTFVLLFNPWLQGDEVFMPNNAEREEYVLSESGVVFMGSSNSISPRGWDFGQFQPDILDICLSILDRSLNHRRDAATDLRRRNDPKYVGRVLSAMVRLLPQFVRILQQCECPLDFGVLTTVLRCFGFPARMISNFNSAHDTDQSLTVDVYYDPAGNPLNMDSDSIWNFHVWNEAWFARSDLGSTYNGWQILDATPQERSSGIFQCGPASLVAIKEGDVDLDYDCPFVYAETNADRVTWTYDTATGQKKKIYSETKSVGQFTSTKAVGSFARKDVTNDYKYPEGSTKERDVFNKARGKLNLSTLEATSRVPDAPKPDVSGKFKVKSPPEVGKDVELVLLLTNLASAARTLTANMTAWSIVYTGKVIHEVWKDSLALTLGPKEEKAYPIKISYEEYQKHLTTDNMIRATAVCHFKDGNDAVVEQDIALENPTITLKVPGQAKVGQAVKVEVVFTNPLAEVVSSCVLLAEGSDLLEKAIRKEVSTVKGKESARITFEITPKKKGTKQLVTNFSCDKFKDINTFQVIKVVD
uniref:Transglutaminase-like domain-containing protein n=1 Tax=Anolis carolinensis TaxID=28377 RepID=A0A803TF20_ANOCA